MSGFVSRGFGGRRRAPEGTEQRLPPGQYVERGFPVLTVGPTPRVDTASWRFRIEGLVEQPREWGWESFHRLPRSEFAGDIHCVTKWSKFDTRFSGVSVDDLLAEVRLAPEATHVMAYSFGGYTTNLPLADITGGKAWVVDEFDGAPLERAHGGPARLLVPHLYFWKSAKWVAGLRVMDHDEPGFWEQNGYHDRGDPWKEERYQGD
jgi:DMSO/TMAO reductase YedYZ molybdopterin-dependent catalytic subunit